MLNEKLAIVYWHGLYKEVGIALASQELHWTLIPAKFTVEITLVYWRIWMNMTNGYVLLQAVTVWSPCWLEKKIWWPAVFGSNVAKLQCF